NLFVDNHPKSANQQQNVDYQQSSAYFQLQNSNFQQPNADFQQRNGEFQQQNPNFQQPIADFQQQNGDFQQLNANFQQQNGDFPQQNANFQHYQVEQQPSHGKRKVAQHNTISKKRLTEADKGRINANYAWLGKEPLYTVGNWKGWGRRRRRTGARRGEGRGAQTGRVGDMNIA
ncbi:hypothetical protein ACH5RR_025995, partial [Cinchona calisaya]